MRVERVRYRQPDPDLRLDGRQPGSEAGLLAALRSAGIADLEKPVFRVSKASIDRRPPDGDPQLSPSGRCMPPRAAVMALAAQCTAGPISAKVIVVDEDIDPTNVHQVLGVATRSRPAQSIDILRET
jgi:hypothetical protein